MDGQLNSTVCGLKFLERLSAVKGILLRGGCGTEFLMRFKALYS